MESQSKPTFCKKGICCVEATCSEIHPKGRPIPCKFGDKCREGPGKCRFYHEPSISEQVKALFVRLATSEEREALISELITLNEIERCLKKA